MFYKIFRDGTDEIIDEVTDDNWPPITVGTILPILEGGREYRREVTAVSEMYMCQDTLVTNVWVK